jgi:hypothetical protein
MQKARPDQGMQTLQFDLLSPGIVGLRLPVPAMDSGLPSQSLIDRMVAAWMDLVLVAPELVVSPLYEDSSLGSCYLVELVISYMVGILNSPIFRVVWYFARVASTNMSGRDLIWLEY